MQQKIKLPRDSRYEIFTANVIEKGKAKEVVKATHVLRQTKRMYP